jgi:hypothetical protein
MFRVVVLALLPLVSVGCLSPVTSRLDLLNEQLVTTQNHLAVVIAELREANQRIARLEGRVSGQ